MTSCIDQKSSGWLTQTSLPRLQNTPYIAIIIFTVRALLYFVVVRECRLVVNWNLRNKIQWNRDRNTKCRLRNGGHFVQGETMPRHYLDTIHDEWKMVFCYLQIQLAISYHWFRYWLGAKQAPNNYLNQWELSLVLTLWCVTRFQWDHCRLWGAWCKWQDNKFTFILSMSLKLFISWVGYEMSMDIVYIIQLLSKIWERKS